MHGGAEQTGSSTTARLSLDDRSGSMTAWKHARLCLFVLLSLINLSEEGCDDYFTIDKMSKYLNHTVYLIKTKDLKDSLECTVERACIDRDAPYCLWLDHCFYRKDIPETVTAKCEGERSVGISHYHFACLVSHYRATNLSEGCKNYEHVCELHRERQLIVSAGTKPSQRPPPTTKATLPETTTTTTLPDTTRTTTTTATTTTAAPPTTTTTAPTTTTAAPTTLPDTTRATTTATTTTTAAPTTTTTTAPTTTTAAPTTLPDTTRATTTTASTTTALSPTVTQSAVSGNNANHSKSVHEAEKDNTSTDPFKILFGISLIFHVIAVLGFLYMHRQRMQDRTLRLNMLDFESNRHLPEAQPMTELKSETPPSSANREEEIAHLMTPRDCRCIVTHSADGEDTQL